MHLLLVPLHLAGERIEGDHTVAVEVVAGMGSRPGGRFNRDEDQASIGIQRRRAPDVRRHVRLVRTAVQPRQVTIRIARLRLRIPGPQEFARDDVPPFDGLALAGLEIGVVDQDVPVDDRRRIRRDALEHAVLPEGRDERAGLGIDRGQARADA
jgi:hypothetical protein